MPMLDNIKLCRSVILLLCILKVKVEGRTSLSDNLYKDNHAYINLYYINHDYIKHYDPRNDSI